MARNECELTNSRGNLPSVTSVVIGISVGAIMAGSLYLDGYWNPLFLLLTWISFTITGLLFIHVGSKLSESKFTTPTIIFLLVGSQTVLLSTVPFHENVAISISILVLGISSATLLLGVVIGSETR